MAALLIFGEDILMLFGASENTLPYAMDYLSIYCLGTVFVQLSVGLNYFINAQGFAKYGMFTLLIGGVLILFLILSLFLVYTWMLQELQLQL